MNRKVVRYIITHPWKCTIAFAIFLISFVITISKFPKIVVDIIAVGLLLFPLATTIISLHKEKQQFQSMHKEDYAKKWMKYADLVDEMRDEKKHGLNTDWFETFVQIIYVIATDLYLLKRKFNDFDIAACLIYSLTWDNNTDEYILFAFECAKKVISEPKEYIRDMGYGYKLELEVENIFPKVNIYLPNEIITAEALTSIIRTYLMQRTKTGIIQLSDFLHILYLKCK